MWNVSESTIKRWADAGTLPCVRTPGGHRRFLLEPIQKFQEEHGFKATGLLKMRQWEEPELSTAASELAPEDKRREVLAAAQNNRRDLVLELLQKLYLRGLTVCELYDRLILPLERHLREQLETRQFSMVQAQLIRNNLEDALHRLFAEAAGRPSNGSLGLCGALDLRRPLLLNGIARILEAEGWECMNLGAGIGFEHLSEMVRSDPVNLVCVVSSARPDPMAAEVSDLARLAHAYQIPILLFGIGFDESFCGCFRESRSFSDFTALRRYLVSASRQG